MEWSWLYTSRPMIVQDTTRYWSLASRGQQVCTTWLAEDISKEEGNEWRRRHFQRHQASHRPKIELRCRGLRILSRLGGMLNPRPLIGNRMGASDSSALAIWNQEQPFLHRNALSNQCHAEATACECSQSPVLLERGWPMEKAPSALIKIRCHFLHFWPEVRVRRTWTLRIAAGPVRMRESNWYLAVAEGWGYTLRGIVDTRWEEWRKSRGGFSGVGAPSLAWRQIPWKAGKTWHRPVNFIFDHLFCSFFDYSWSALYFLIMSSSPGRKLEAEDVSLLLCIATILYF